MGMECQGFYLPARKCRVRSLDVSFLRSVESHWRVLSGAKTYRESHLAPEVRNRGEKRKTHWEVFV